MRPFPSLNDYRARKQTVRPEDVGIWGEEFDLEDDTFDEHLPARVFLYRGFGWIEDHPTYNETRFWASVPGGYECYATLEEAEAAQHETFRKEFALED